MEEWQLQLLPEMSIIALYSLMKLIARSKRIGLKRLTRIFSLPFPLDYKNAKIVRNNLYSLHKKTHTDGSERETNPIGRDVINCQEGSMFLDG